MSDNPEGMSPSRGAGRNIARALRRRRLPNVDGGRPCAHQVMASAQEEAAIQARAKVLGVTVPRLLLESALDSGQPGAAASLAPADKLAITDGMYSLSVLVRQLGRNVNQIAKATNAGGEIGDELVATLAAVRRTLERIDAAMLDVSR
jgi:hypothetical protein